MEDTSYCDLEKNTSSLELEQTNINPCLSNGKGSSLIYKLYKNHQTALCDNLTTTQNYLSPRLFFKKCFGIQTVCAESLVGVPFQNFNNENSEAPSLLEQFAQTYIEKETGMDRISVIFKRDHQFRLSHEVQFMTRAMLQTYCISFMVKYIPTWYEARREFIKDHHGTVFRTKTQALKLLSDTVLLKSLMAAGRFALKVTFFSTTMLCISQMISAYRNKTSPIEYTVGGALTGGLLRLNMGFRGVIAGSILAGIMGTIAGGMITGLMRSTGFTQEERHLEVIMERLEMERSLVGDEAFRRKMITLVEGADQVELMANKMQQ